MVGGFYCCYGWCRWWSGSKLVGVCIFNGSVITATDKMTVMKSQLFSERPGYSSSYGALPNDIL